MTVPFSRKNPPGNYTAEIIRRDGSVLSSLSIHFPGIGKWAEMEFDKTVILPPFTPLKVNGTDYSMWGRTYSYENSLFPCRIQSQGVELLSAPCEIVANGRAVGNGKTEEPEAAFHPAGGACKIPAHQRGRFLGGEADKTGEGRQNGVPLLPDGMGRDGR